jgi:tetratricopeptide (TPR) repeat protein
MKRFILIILFLNLSLSAQAQISEAQAQIRFKDGVEAYKKADYEGAIADFEDILKGERESGEVYFNLGNSYFKNKNLGKAILNYKRAKELMPRDSDLKYNFQYALAQIKETEKEKGNVFTRLKESLLNFYTTGEMVGITVIMTFIIALIFLLALYLKWKNVFFKVITGTLAFLWLVFACGVYLKIQSRQNEVVILKETPATFEPRKEATTYFVLNEGHSVQIVQKDGEWLKIRRSDGKLGWIPGESAEKI